MTTRSGMAATVAAGEVLRRLRNRDVGGEWRGAPPAEFTGVTVDSRDVKPGFLFCAVPGTRTDGHEFLPEAAAAGAAAAVVERPREEVELPQLVVLDGRRAAAHLASLFHGDPGRKLRLVAVTGTNGKTTTAWIARHLLAGREPAGAIGTLGVVDPAGEVHPGELTTPGPVELARSLATLADGGAETVAMEVSSHALDQRRTDALDFEAAAFTTLSRDHLDYHRNMREYRDTKLRLADRVRPDGTCVVNADEPGWRDREFSGRRVVTFGLEGEADLRASETKLFDRRSRFVLHLRAESREVELPLVGDFNVSNALAAAGLALSSDRSLGEVAERLEGVPQVPGRLEVLRRGPPVVIRDYAHTPEAMERAISAVRPAAAGKIIAVFGAGGDRDRGKRPEMGRVAARLADWSVVTNDNPRTEDPTRIARDIVEGMPEGSYEVELDREAAIRGAYGRAGEEDVILLLGKGHETYMVLGEERVPFDEAEIVRSLPERGPGR